MTVSSHFTKWLQYNAVFKPLARIAPRHSYPIATRLGQRFFDPDGQLRAYIANEMTRLMPDSPAAIRDDWAAVFCEVRGREILDTYVMRRLHHLRDQPVVTLADGTLDVLRDARKGGRGVILTLAHYGRVNMMLAGLGLAGERLGMLTMDIDAPNPALDEVERAYLKVKVQALQNCIKGPWLTLGGAVRPLYETLRRGETLIILFDVPVDGSTQTKSVPFFGGSLTISRGIERLAQKTGAQIVYAVAKEQDWHVITELRALPENPGDALVAAVGELERDVRSTPGLWWQWGLLDALWNRQ
jgi:lauroyl/myristoyl acyltransferase